MLEFSMALEGKETWLVAGQGAWYGTDGMDTQNSVVVTLSVALGLTEVV